MADLHTRPCALLPHQLTVSSNTTWEKIQLEASVVKASKYDWAETATLECTEVSTAYLLGGLEGAGPAQRDPEGILISTKCNTPVPERGALRGGGAFAPSLKGTVFVGGLASPLQSGLHAISHFRISILAKPLSTEGVQPSCYDGWSQRVATGDDNIVLKRGTKKLPIGIEGDPGTSPSDYFPLTRTPYKALVFAY